MKKYLPVEGEGNNRATQAVTAMTKLIYKWYNDGDVFDNTYCLDGWCNDLSSFANWLANYTQLGNVLSGISNCLSFDDYEWLLKRAAIKLFNEDVLKNLEKLDKIDSIYKAKGQFRFEDEHYDEEEDY